MTTIGSFMFHPHSVSYEPVSGVIGLNDDFVLRRDDGHMESTICGAGISLVTPPRGQNWNLWPEWFDSSSIVSAWSESRGYDS